MALRALAHPLRLDLQGIVAVSGPITAAEAARRLGISQALASHHLRELARYGFVEQVEGPDRRSRPWRVTSTSHSWRGAEDRPEAADAVAVLDQLVTERAMANYLEWRQRRDATPPAWRKHSGMSNSNVHLTLEEFAELGAAIDALVGRYVEERPLDEVETHPAGSVLVNFTMFAYPVAQPTETG